MNTLTLKNIINVKDKMKVANHISLSSLLVIINVYIIRVTDHISSCSPVVINMYINAQYKAYDRKYYTHCQLNTNKCKCLTQDTLANVLLLYSALYKSESLGAIRTLVSVILIIL